MIAYKPSAGAYLRLQTLAMSCKDHTKKYKGRVCRQRLCYQDDPRPKDNYWPTPYVTMEKNSDNALRVAWCPDILGNERADQLTKQVTLLPSSSEPTITHTASVMHANT